MMKSAMILVMVTLLGRTLAFDGTCELEEGEICSTIISNQVNVYEVKDELSDVLKNVTEELSKHKAEMDRISEMLNRNLEEEAAKKEEYQSCQQMMSDKQVDLDDLIKKKNDRIEASNRKEEDVGRLKVELESLKKKKVALRERISCTEGQLEKRKGLIRDLAIRAYVPTDCADLQLKGETEDKVYTIYPRQDELAVQVRCDFKSDGGGWTIFFSRGPQDVPQDFNLSWEDFKRGVGNASTEYFMSLDVLNILSASYPTSMRIDAMNFTGFERFAQWQNFQVDNEENKYKLQIGGFLADSTMGDSLKVNNNCFFTTKDVDNDKHKGGNCATPETSLGVAAGPWWYASCGLTRLTAPLVDTGSWNSALWFYWVPNTREGTSTSLSSFSLKLRRHNFIETAKPLEI